MDAEKHVREKERLNQALNGNLDKITEDIKNVLRKNNLERSKTIDYVCHSRGNCGHNCFAN